MYGILGSSIRSRFVFLAVPDHGEPPDLRDLKRLLNCSDVNIYKADGYFKHSFSEIEWLLHLHKRGITHETSWSLNQKFFSHVIKLSSRCEWNAMAEIKYSQQLVIRLELDEQRLRNLDNLLRGIRKLKSQLSEGNNAHSAVHRAIESLRKVELMRNSHRIPTDADIERFLISLENLSDSI